MGKFINIGKKFVINNFNYYYKPNGLKKGEIKVDTEVEIIENTKGKDEINGRMLCKYIITNKAKEKEVIAWIRLSDIFQGIKI